MAELTKEWLKQTIAEYEANRDELPFGLDTNSAIELQAFKLALASLEAEPVAYIFKHPAGKLFWALTDESNKEQSDVIPVYAAPPVPVVPEEKPMPNPLKMYAVDAVAAIAEVRGWNACRAAMLQGSQHVSQTYNLPELIEGMEVSIDVSTCDADLGNRYFGTVTEALELDTAKNGYILLVQDAEPNFDINGNSPVTPDGWVMVPKELTPEMMRAVQIRSELGGYATSNLSGAYNMFSEFWNVAVSAAPKVDDL
ncbi:DUF551 domain-containing protein [Escherichia coli]|uniref:hypothetical protein n=1 Tax=Escherichia coli TaxID=562 RepID=UPI000AD4CF6F|nr:hypothetical protein [Escherichia coli]EAC1503198.1 DUF551 domain-containing protein [Escherichia coli]EFH4639114.1 DUF551 domain-containing protein [Escherichia coli]EFN3966987.1 DUF551 domain-containing protein [Escherichia coli]EFO2640864.1 DUF551 domain-containing protein [Escherichia coli]EGI6792443.1 DUF551 domain-containing protein [Escherichia coli]